MFWILRRTGAVNFFNSINNNYAAKSHSMNVYNDSGRFRGMREIGLLYNHHFGEEERRDVRSAEHAF